MTETLEQAEVEMLRVYVKRAGLKNGMKILDLGYALSSPRYSVPTIE
jgi:cyclopropane fatty-acyl-phospholipid synthase-like methyltransferase